MENNSFLSTTRESLRTLQHQGFDRLNFLLGRFKGDARDESLFFAYDVDRKEIEAVYHDLAVIRRAIVDLVNDWGNMTEAKWNAYLFTMATDADFDVGRHEAWVRLRDELS